MSGQHKFGFGTDGGYRTIVYCEYCGHVAFYCNQHDLNDERQRVAKEPCPRTPPEEKPDD